LKKVTAIYLSRHIPIRREYPEVPLGNVRAPTDLPPYLFLGPLDESGFISSENGWNATWKRDEATWFHIDYDRKADGLTCRDCWKGLDGHFSGMHGGDLKKLARIHFLAPFSEWEDLAAKTFQERWNINYCKPEKTDVIIAGMPDGLMKTLILPVQANWLPVLRQTFAGFLNDAQIDFPVGGFVTLLDGGVWYSEQGNPHWVRSPEELLKRTADATGLPPVGQPERECANDGNAGRKVRRSCFAAFIHVPFAGLGTLLNRLGEAGLLSAGPMNSNPIHPGADSVEFSGCVLPASKEVQLKGIAWSAKDGRRRVFWNMPKNYLELLQGHPTAKRV
jgi:hypothetical protein